MHHRSLGREELRRAGYKGLPKQREREQRAGVLAQNRKEINSRQRRGIRQDLCVESIRGEMSHFGRFSIGFARASSKRRFDSISAASAFSERLFPACQQPMSEGRQSALLLLALRLVGQSELDETFFLELE